MIGEGAFIGSNRRWSRRCDRRRGDRRRRVSDHQDVEADSLAIARGEQKGIAGWARRFRERMTARRKQAAKR